MFTIETIEGKVWWDSRRGRMTGEGLLWERVKAKVGEVVPTVETGPGVRGATAPEDVAYFTAFAAIDVQTDRPRQVVTTDFSRYTLTPGGIP